jgi:hypothetical protein
MSDLKAMWDLLEKSDGEVLAFKLYKNKGDKKPFRMIVLVEGEEACQKMAKFTEDNES